MRTKVFQSVATGLLVLLVTGACGGGSDARSDAAGAQNQPSAETTAAPSTDPTTKEPAEKPAGGTGKVIEAEIIDTDFRPLTIKVDAGTKVHWTQIGDQPHSVTAVDDSFDSNPKCGPLDSEKCLGEGDGFSFVFEEPGTYIYYCRVHGLPDGTGMVAEVIVR